MGQDQPVCQLPEEPLVAVLPATYRTIEGQLEAILSLLDYRPRRQQLLLKPNLVNLPGPRLLGGIRPYANTDLRFIEALLRVLRGYDITIAEGSTIDTDRVLQESGLLALARRYGAQVVNLDRAERYPVPWAYGTLRLPQLLQTHEYINLPKLKTHYQTTVSLGCKNQKGLLTHADKVRFHHQLDLHAAIHALADVVRPALTIVDGINAMDGPGPTHGHLRRANLIVAGRDVRAVDVACCDLMAVPVEQVGHLERGPYQMVGRPVETLRQHFRLEQELTIGNVHFHVVDSTCSRCMQSMYQGVFVWWRSPRRFLRGLWSCIVHRTDIITGRADAVPPAAVGRLICYGDCTRQLAEKHGLRWVPGCPPSLQQHLEIY